MKAQTNNLFSNHADTNHIEGPDVLFTLVTYWSYCNPGNKQQIGRAFVD